MKLVNFSYRDQPRVGVINEEGLVVDLTPALQSRKSWPPDMIDFINMGDEGIALAEGALAAGNANIIPAEELIWLPPCPPSRENMRGGPQQFCQ